MIYDVCVVGSGAGAGPIIYELSRAGLKVCVLEKGDIYNEKDFSKDEIVVRRDIYTPNLKEEYHTIEEFVDLEKRILRYSFEVLPTGLTRVIDNGGNFGVNDLEKDIDSILKLLFEAIRLNYESFFVENLQRMGVLEKIMPQDNL